MICVQLGDGRYPVTGDLARVQAVELVQGIFSAEPSVREELAAMAALFSRGRLTVVQRGA